MPLVVKNLPANAGDAFCLENSLQRRLAGYSPWGHKESDMTERLNTHTHTHIGVIVICPATPFTRKHKMDAILFKYRR